MYIDTIKSRIEVKTLKTSVSELVRSFMSVKIRVSLMILSTSGAKGQKGRGKSCSLFQ